MHDRGMCGRGGMCGSGVCVAGWGVCGKRVCMVGVCVAGLGVCGRRDGHCSGRYASYWNSFLSLSIPYVINISTHNFQL